MKSSDGRFEYLKLNYDPSSAIEKPDRFSFKCPRTGEMCSGLLLVGADLGNGKFLTREIAQGKVACWDFDGNIDAPTLRPSIHCKSRTDDGREAAGCDWHGFIERGKFRNA